MIAALISLNALAIDIMLPALGAIATDLGVDNNNNRQLVVISYIIGLGVPQLIFGPITDRYGRRPPLFIALIGYIATGLLCMRITRFDLLLGARFAQGVFASGIRVVASAVVRDVATGPSMARIMSLVMTMFMIVPILAPGLGQLILFVGPWQWCFGALVVAGTGMLIWTGLRLPESTEPANRNKQSLWHRIVAYREILRYRESVGYMLASSCLFGSLFGFISTSEQIFRDVFGQGDRFALWFAGVALTMSLSNLTNSRLVTTLGPRRLSHRALVAFVAIVAIGLAATVQFGDRLDLFYCVLIFAFACFGMIGANFSATAMEPLGRMAGTGSAAYGFVTTTGSGLLGGIIGQAYDGSTVPLLTGYLLLGLSSLLIVVITERTSRPSEK